MILWILKSVIVAAEEFVMNGRVENYALECNVPKGVAVKV